MNGWQLHCRGYVLRWLLHAAHEAVDSRQAGRGSHGCRITAYTVWHAEEAIIH